MRLIYSHFYKPKNCPYSKPIKDLQDSNLCYRFSFNGKENDDECRIQDYGMRIYNSRLGKFLSVDPLQKKYPFVSPYHFAGNSPINFIDLDGLEVQITGVAADKLRILLQTNTGLELGLDANGMLVYATTSIYDPFSDKTSEVPKINNPNSSSISVELRKLLVMAIKGGEGDLVKINAMTRSEIKLNSPDGKTDVVQFDQFPGEGVVPKLDNAVDVTDFIQISEEVPFQNAMLAHVIGERLSSSKGFEKAHAAGISYETKVMKEYNPLATDRNEDPLIKDYWDGKSQAGVIINEVRHDDKRYAKVFSYGKGGTYTTIGTVSKGQINANEVKGVRKSK
jgi:RHS repeat-associated protein